MSINEHVNVMFVDDDEVTGSVMKRNCDNSNFSCTIFDNAEQCLDEFMSQPADLVITDLRMPGMNGFQATRQISKASETSSIPVIMVTTKDQETDKVWAMRQGAKDYIVKPVQEKALIEHVNMVLSA